MEKWLRAYNAAPPTVRAASAVSAVQLLGLLAVAGLAATRGGFSLPRTPAPIAWASVVLGVILLGMLFILPLGMTVSRYPRRRHREALLFEGVMLFVFVDASSSRPSIVGAAWIVAGLAAMLLLLAPASRRYATERERRFAEADTL
jgi:hypothetical protein